MSSYDTEASYRRMHRTTVISTLVSIVPVGILLIGISAQSWQEAVLLGAAFLLACGIMGQGGRSGYPRFGTAGLVLSLMVWIVGAMVLENSMAFFPLVMVGSIVVPRLPRWRIAGLIGLGVVTGAVGATAVGRNSNLQFLEFVVVPSGIALFVTALMLYNDKYWTIFHELELAREGEAELAVMRERARFASDLHDIQGHALHVVKLKLALVEKLLKQDAVRAAIELREVHELVGDTITETKALVYAQRRLNLSAELENAKNLFEAADICVTVKQVGREPQGRVNELLGQVLRETTTNILRHAQAKKVDIALSEWGITVVNDGVSPGAASANSSLHLRGLANLRDRVTQDSGTMTIEQHEDTFVTGARFSAVAPSRGVSP